MGSTYSYDDINERDIEHWTCTCGRSYSGPAGMDFDCMCGSFTQCCGHERSDLNPEPDMHYKYNMDLHGTIQVFEVCAHCGNVDTYEVTPDIGCWNLHKISSYEPNYRQPDNTYRRMISQVSDAQRKKQVERDQERAWLAAMSTWGDTCVDEATARKATMRVKQAEFRKRMSFVWDMSRDIHMQRNYAQQVPDIDRSNLGRRGRR